MNRFFESPGGDMPLTMAPPAPPETTCQLERDGGSPIRIIPSEPFAGSSSESDRIINRWRPRIANLVEQSIEMARDLCEISWRADEEPYPCCPFLKIVEPSGRDMRQFTDEACHILLQASVRDEIVEAYWFDGRPPDARDVSEWMERWGVWLPDEEGQFRFWSVFLPCEAMEALYRYVHALVHDYYLEILELHREWEENHEEEFHGGDCDGGDCDGGNSLPDVYQGVPDQIIYWHPRLVLDDREFTLTSENAEELRDWSYEAFVYWGKRITKEQKEALVMLGMEADQLCPEQRWPD
jgi:hypothetical protein